MVFCYSDINGGNFIVDDENQVTIVDFDELSILPLSFAKYVLLANGFDGLGLCIRPWVKFPDTEQDNASTLLDLSAPIIQGSLSFHRVGLRVPGGDSVNRDES